MCDSKVKGAHLRRYLREGASGLKGLGRLLHEAVATYTRGTVPLPKYLNQQG